jgi:hypothetical protein
MAVIEAVQFPRSFYIRFAKITLQNSSQLPSPSEQDYNVFRFQAFSASTLATALASHM